MKPLITIAVISALSFSAAAIADDNGAQNPTQGYAGHYCNVPTRVDPTIVACSMIISGLRVFDISDLLHPKEIAYYVAPTQPRAENEFMASDFAMSKPVIVPDRASATRLTLRSLLTKPGWNHLEVRTMRGVLSTLAKRPRDA